MLKSEYVAVKQSCGNDCASGQAGTAILKLAKSSLRFLVTACELVNLVSRVPGKQYVSFKKASVVARPVNDDLFIQNPIEVGKLWGKWLADAIDAREFARLTYTVALSPFLAIELGDRQNKKGPATFFECYVGHLFARAIGVNPTKRARLVVQGRSVLMTMDFLFDLGGGRRKIHLPVKMSTRERVVQAWAHQRLLDAAHGPGTYRGIMVLFSETKLDSRSLEVVEICVPDQWLAYQSLLAHFDRIYYFDLPVRYQTLTSQHPNVITIKQFGEFFTERETVLHS
jgi:hypothetical protein